MMLAVAELRCKREATESGGFGVMIEGMFFEGSLVRRRRACELSAVSNQRSAVSKNEEPIAEGSELTARFAEGLFLRESL
jgi:hypothetical protein